MRSEAIHYAKPFVCICLRLLLRISQSIFNIEEVRTSKLYHCSVRFTHTLCHIQSSDAFFFFFWFALLCNFSIASYYFIDFVEKPMAKSIKKNKKRQIQMWEKVNTYAHLLAYSVDNVVDRFSLILRLSHFFFLLFVPLINPLFDIHAKCELKINIDSFVRLQVSRSNWSCAKWSHRNKFFFSLLSTFSNCHTLFFSSSFACCLIFTRRKNNIMTSTKKKKITRLTALAPIKFNKNKSILVELLLRFIVHNVRIRFDCHRFKSDLTTMTTTTTVIKTSNSDSMAFIAYKWHIPFGCV